MVRSKAVIGVLIAIVAVLITSLSAGYGVFLVAGGTGGIAVGLGIVAFCVTASVLYAVGIIISMIFGFTFIEGNLEGFNNRQLQRDEDPFDDPFFDR